MFGMNNRERDLYERLLAEKDRVINVLADQVDWHRAQTGTFFPTPITGVAEESPTTEEQTLETILADMGMGLDRDYEDEDEAEIRWQVAHGAVSPEAAAAMLQAMEADRPIEDLLTHDDES